ncbi:Nitroreductase family protein [Enhydrobacter sp. 8BJ]|nr:nitroreductase family protein [Enhydrobacter sp. 8BJ]VXB09843.1 Nitroreductase family protein [Enhydrobacter sp. 8BJ]
MSVETLHAIAETRRSIYMLNDQLPVSKDEVVKLVEHAVLHTPSSFNSQSSRLVVLFGEDHQKLWQITEDLLRAMVNDDEKFKSTADKMAMFKAGAGTILYFEDQSVVKGLQEQFPLYAHNFPVWAEHTSAMHQYAIWNALAAVNIGANLQHYNGVIDEKVAQIWNIDSNWKLIAQMVFGGIAAPAGEKTFEPIEKRLKVYGK